MSDKLKVIFYREDAPIFDGYEHNFFHTAVWLALPDLLGEATRVEVDCRFYNVGLTEGFYFDPLPGDWDIAYSDKCVPTRRPAKLYFSVQSDWRGEEARITGWMERAKPDLLLNMYSPAQTLIDACKKCGVRYEYAPWFVVDLPSENYDRPVLAMNTGAMGSHYLWRLRIAEKLRSMRRPDVIVSEKLGLTYNQYLSKLSQTRYYCSGGSDDDVPEIASIPHKFIEVCNYGCCLVSPHMPFMERAGFIDGETYIKLNHVDELPGIMASDRWRQIGRASQVMVQERHTVEARAALIKQIYKEITHAN